VPEAREILVGKIDVRSTVDSGQLRETFVNEEEFPTYTRFNLSSIDMPVVKNRLILGLDRLDFRLHLLVFEESFQVVRQILVRVRTLVLVLQADNMSCRGVSMCHAHDRWSPKDL
jgi:hypothetical protein